MIGDGRIALAVDGGITRTNVERIAGLGVDLIVRGQLGPRGRGSGNE